MHIKSIVANQLRCRWMTSHKHNRKTIYASHEVANSVCVCVCDCVSFSHCSFYISNFQSLSMWLLVCRRLKQKVPWKRDRKWGFRMIYSDMIHIFRLMTRILSVQWPQSYKSELYVTHMPHYNKTAIYNCFKRVFSLSLSLVLVFYTANSSLNAVLRTELIHNIRGKTEWNAFFQKCIQNNQNKRGANHGKCRSHGSLFWNHSSNWKLKISRNWTTIVKTPF